MGSAVEESAAVPTDVPVQLLGQLPVQSSAISSDAMLGACASRAKCLHLLPADYAAVGAAAGAGSFGFAAGLAAGLGAGAAASPFAAAAALPFAAPSAAGFADAFAAGFAAGFVPAAAPPLALVRLAAPSFLAPSFFAASCCCALARSRRLRAASFAASWSFLYASSSCSLRSLIMSISVQRGRAMKRIMKSWLERRRAKAPAALVQCTPYALRACPPPLIPTAPTVILELLVNDKLALALVHVLGREHLVVDVLPFLVGARLGRDNRCDGLPSRRNPAPLHFRQPTSALSQPSI